MGFLTLNRADENSIYCMTVGKQSKTSTPMTILRSKERSIVEALVHYIVKNCSSVSGTESGADRFWKADECPSTKPQHLDSPVFEPLPGENVVKVEKDLVLRNPFYNLTKMEDIVITEIRLLRDSS